MQAEVNHQDNTDLMLNVILFQEQMHHLVHRQISDRVAQELLIECALIRKVPEGEEGKRQKKARLSEATVDRGTSQRKSWSFHRWNVQTASWRTDDVGASMANVFSLISLLSLLS